MRYNNRYILKAGNKRNGVLALHHSRYKVARLRLKEVFQWLWREKKSYGYLLR